MHSANQVHVTPDLEAVVASTLCLMSFFGRTRCPQAAEKISLNLRTLVTHPAASDAFRDICESLVRHWCQTCVSLQESDTELSLPAVRLH